MAGVELATAYVTIVPSLKGAQRSIESQLKGVDLKKSGESIGRTLSKGMGASVGSDAMRPLLQSVKRAEGEVQSAMGRSSSAMKGVEAAQRRLAEAREKYGDDSSQAARAEVALIEAQSRAERAGMDLERAQTRLADAQEEAATASQRASEAASAQAASYGRLASVSAGLGKAGSALTSVGGAARSLGGMASSVGQALSGVGDTLTTHVTLPAIAAGAAFGTFALRTASAAETTQISLTTMLGSEERALSMMDELASFAAHTPFELSGLQDATRQLLAYGFTADDVIPMLTDVGDATAALGTGQAGIESVTRALGQMKTRGKVSAEEMLQLTEAGIPAWEYLARTIGTDTAGAMDKVTDGAVSASVGIAAVTQGMREDFGGMMEEQSKTVEGLFSNLSDAIEQPLMKLRESDSYDEFADSLGRVVESAGPFVEELLPHMESGLEVVSDVLDAASDAMDGFSEMSERDQERIIGLVGAAAAAGPALTVMGKGLDLAGGGLDLLGRGIERAGSLATSAGKGLGSLSDTLVDVATSPKMADTVLGKLAGTIASYPGVTALAVGGVALLVSGIVSFVDCATEAEREAETQSDALQVLRSSARIAGEGMEEASDGPRALGTEIASLGDEIQENWQSIADLGESFRSIDREASASISQLGVAKSAVADYAGQTDLSAQELGSLRAAVEAINDQCGTSYEVVQDAGGAYQVMADGAVASKDAIYELIDAQIQQAKIDASTQKLESLYAEQAEQAEEYASALAQVAAAQDAYNARYQELMDQHGDEKIAEAGSHYLLDDLEEAKANLSEVTGQMEATGQAVEQLEAQIGNAAAGGAQSFADLVEGSGALRTFFDETGGDAADFAADLEASGISLEALGDLSDSELAQIAASWDGTTESIVAALTRQEGAGEAYAQSLMESLEAAGVSTETLNEVGSANISALAQAFGGNIDAMVWALGEYNAVPIVNKDGTVSVNDASLVDAEGRLWSWNGSTLVDQHGTAIVDDTSLADAQGNVYVWNGSALVPMSTTATVTGNTVDGSAEAGISGTNDATGDMASKTVTDSVTGTALTAAPSIWDTVNAINSLTSRSVTVDTTFNEYRNVYTNNVAVSNAAGGVRLNAEGGIVPRLHADGAIATRAVPLDIVGEDGAEAIVPLTNRRYSQPFADIIAEGVVRAMGGPSRDEAVLRSMLDVLHGIYRAVSARGAARDFDRAVWAAVGRR